MPLKDLNAAGALGAVISAAGRSLNSLANQYGGESSVLATALKEAGVVVTLPNTPEVTNLVRQLLASVQISTDDEWAQLPGGYFAEQVLVDAKGVLIPAAVAVGVLVAMQSLVPSNDL